MAQSHRGQGQTYKGYGHMSGCHPELSGHARLHINRRNTTGIIAGCPPPTTKNIYNCRLATYQGWAANQHQTILAVQGWASSNRWCITKRQVHNHTRQPKATSTHTAAHKPHRHWKTKLFAHESVFWHKISADTETYIKLCATCLEFQQTRPKEKLTHHNTLLRPWEVIGVDIFHFKNKHYLCIIDYNSKFSVIKRLEGLSADNLINAVKTIFTKYGIPLKLMWDAGIQLCIR